MEHLFHEDSQYTDVWKDCVVCLRPLNREDSDKCTLTITCTAMLQ